MPTLSDHAGRLITALLAVLLLSSCENIPLPVGHGHIELDENTDPRFFKPDTEGRIGTLLVRGNDAYLNQRPVRTRQRLNNGDHVRTGSGSRASLAFRGIFSDKCPRGIRIEEFRTGKLLGRTRTCRHHLTTSNGRLSTEGSRVEYHINTYDGFTELTMIKGSAFISLLEDPHARVSVTGGHGVTLEGSRITRPRRLSPGEIDQRIEWSRTEVPELIGMSLQEADRALHNAGLKKGDVSSVETRSKRMVGRIAKQKPRPGSRVEYDTSVRLWLGKQAQQLIEVPNLIGRSLGEAEKILAEAGLGVGEINHTKNNGQYEPWHVKQQSPKGGSQAEPDSPVNLWLWDNSNIVY